MYRLCMYVYHPCCVALSQLKSEGVRAAGGQESSTSGGDNFECCVY